MVTTSPSSSRAASTRVPLTKVPLILRLSTISMPPGVGIRVAWCREASTSGMTMLLSVARPMVSDPGGGGAEEAPGRRILSIEVARFEVPGDPPRDWAGPIWVGAASLVWAGAAWAGAVGLLGGAYGGNEGVWYDGG